ncbi:hypothetical protein BK669_17905 [Pseudomonas fluorescens]|nr:hypothetical protein BK669_17905 [Pseudomonas fluorescens]
MYNTVMRYLDHEKFEWLLADNGIYVSPLADQKDKTEGEYDSTFLSRALRETSPDIDSELLNKLDDLQHSLKERGKEKTFINSWYLGSDETHRMWKTFGTKGVLIISTDVALEMLLPRPLNQAIEFKPVIYDDELKQHASQAPFQVKASKYHPDKEGRFIFDLTKYSVLTGFGVEPGYEVRVGDKLSYESEEITSCMSPESLEQSHRVIEKKGRGYILRYNLPAIIHEVRLHPEATDADLVRVQERLQAIGIECPVNHSTLRSA